MALSRTTSAQGQDEVLTVQEVAEFLKVTSKTVYSLVREGELPAFRVGRVLRCRRVDVDSFITARMSCTNGNGTGHSADSSVSGGRG